MNTFRYSGTCFATLESTIAADCSAGFFFCIIYFFCSQRESIAKHNNFPHKVINAEPRASLARVQSWIVKKLILYDADQSAVVAAGMTSGVIKCASAFQPRGDWVGRRMKGETFWNRCITFWQAQCKLIEWDYSGRNAVIINLTLTSVEHLRNRSNEPRQMFWNAAPACKSRHSLWAAN